MAKGSDAEQWSELADLILMVARELQFRPYVSDRALSLTPSEGMVMRHMQVEPETTFPRLIEATGLLRTNLSTVLRGLERKGLIERRVRPEDRRVTTVHRTERGRDNYQIVRAEWGANLAQAATDDSRDAEELSRAVRLLEQLKDGMIAARSSRVSRDNLTA